MTKQRSRATARWLMVLSVGALIALGLTFMPVSAFAETQPESPASDTSSPLVDLPQQEAETPLPVVEDAAPSDTEAIVPAEDEPTIEVPQDESLAADSSESIATHSPDDAADSAPGTNPCDDTSETAQPAGPLDSTPSDEADATSPADTDADNAPSALAEDADPSDTATDNETAPAPEAESAEETTATAAAADPTASSLTTQATGSLPSTPAGATKAVVSGRAYVLQGLVTSNRVATTARRKARAGTNVIVSTYTGKNGQVWVAKRYGKTLWYRLFLSGSGNKLALGVSGTNVRIVKNATSGKKLLTVLWAFVSTGSDTFRLVNASNTTSSLDVSGGSTKKKANLHLAPTTGAQPRQTFRMVEAKPKIAKGAKGLSGAWRLSVPSDSGLSVGTKSSSRAQGAKLTLQDTSGSRTQQIYLQHVGKGCYVAWIVGSGRVLTPASSSILPDTKVVQRAYKGDASQKWAVIAKRNANGTYSVKLQNKATGLMLGSATTTSGSSLTGQSKKGSNIRFTLTKESLLTEGITTITPLSTAKTAVGIPKAATGTAKVALATNDSSFSQRFELQQVGGGYWRIRTASSGGWITWTGGSKIRQTGSSSTAVSSANSWKAVWKNGGVVLVNRASGKALELYRGKTKAGTTLVAAKSTGSAAQHFVCTPSALVANGIYLINSKWSGRRLRVDDDANAPANISNPKHGSSAASSEKFAFTKVGDAYKIVNVRSGLPVSGGGYADGDGNANVGQQRNTGKKNQLWKVQIGDDGYLEFVNVESGKYLVSRNSNSESGDGVWPAYNVVERNAAEKSTYLTGCSWKLKAAKGTVNTSPVAGTTALMIGNSFTYYNHDQLSHTMEETFGPGSYVDQAAASGKSLAQHLDPLSTNAEAKALARQTLKKLYFGDWDYVVLQEKTVLPLTDYDNYLTNLKLLVNLTRKIGATPVIYATWAFDGRDTGDGALGLGITRDQMADDLHAAFVAASDATGVTIADVGSAFRDRGFDASLYYSDNKHPSVAGSVLAGQVIASTIRGLA